MELMTTHGPIPLYRLVKELRQFGFNLDGVDSSLNVSNGGLALSSAEASLTATGGALRVVGADLTLGEADATGGGFGLSSTFDLGSDNYAAAWFKSTSAADAGPCIILFQDSASPAADDYVGIIYCYGRDSGGNLQNYGNMEWYLIDPTSGSEDSQFYISIQNAGTAVSAMSLGRTDAAGNFAAGLFSGGANEYSSLQVQNTAAAEGGPGLMFYHNSVSPATDDDVGWLSFRGRNSANEITRYGAINCYIADATDASEDAYFLIGTLVAGTYARRLVIGDGVYAGNPTGGDKGPGTVNATAVYDDNVLLTCYAYAAGETGSVDLAFWDEKVGREHLPARRFAARLGTEHDPTTIAGQRRHMADNRHLTPYPSPDKYTEKNRPSLGGWLQSGVEMDELLFLYVTQLEDRVAQLEEKCSSLN